MQLKSYDFNKYKTKHEEKNIEVTILGSKKNINKKKFDRFSSILEGTKFTKIWPDAQEVDEDSIEAFNENALD